MGEDIRFGTVAGVPVGASWTLMVILGLITWTLGAAVLPAVAPDTPTAATWAVAVVAAVAFLACLLAHELAHALVAMSRGMQVDGITLWMFGGVSRLGSEAPDARTERRMALAGPLVSLGLGVGFVALSLVLDVAGAPDVVVAATSWLGVINGMLAAFNLLPAFPLDGGRVLRAAIWRRTGDLRRATTVATRYGRYAGYALMFLGAFAVLAGGGIGGIWIALLGWIILDAARTEAAGFELRSLLSGVRVADVMTPDPVTVPADLTVEALIRDYVAPYRCSAFPVTDDRGRAAGLVALSRIRDLPGDARATTPVSQVATSLDQVATARPDDDLVDLVGRFTAGSGRRALVMEGPVAVGIVTASDIDRALEVAGVDGSALRTPSSAPR